MWRLLLIALLCIVGISLSASCKRSMKAPSAGEDGAREGATEEADEESGQTNGNTIPADKLDVCSRLTREEVEAALGKSVADPVAGPAITSRRAGTVTSSCMFSSNDGFVSLDIKRQDITSKTIWNAAKAYEGLKDLIVRAHGAESSGKLEVISGVGINAFAETKEETANYKTTELRVLSTHSILTVRVVGSSATPTVEIAKTLAGKAIARQESAERTTLVAAPVVPTPTPEPAAKIKEDRSSNGPEKPPAERKKTNETKRSPSPQRARDATTAIGRKSKARTAAESRSTARRKPVTRPVRKSTARTKRR